MKMYLVRDLSFPEYERGKFECAVMEDGAHQTLIGYFPSRAMADRVATALENISGKPKFYSCGICGWYHSASFDGDCRDDSERFTSFDLDMKYGSEGWEEVEMPV